ncbi:MAG: PspC domain-containing protein [Anaerolineaceae bacterium]|nr:PspC domain-containing protein [Anaerolineaceae bacterium]
MATSNKLYRSTDNSMIAGVCAGLGEYFDIDPTIVRLIFVALFFAGFSSLLAYVICWIVIPEKPVTTHTSTPTGEDIIDLDSESGE